jgi:hypothetical protein
MAKRQSSEMRHGLTAAENARQRYLKEAHSARYKRSKGSKRATRFATADGLRETIRQAYLRKLGH